MQQEQLKIRLRAQIQNQLKALNPNFDKQDFVNFLVQPIESSPNMLQLGSRLIRELNTTAQQKWNEFKEQKIKAQKESWKHLLNLNYQEHEKLGGSKYIDFLYTICENDPQGTKAKEINDLLQNPGTKLTPPFWYEFLKTSELFDFKKELFERLEKLRRDPQFPNYIDFRKKHVEKARQNISQKKMSDQELRQFKQMEGLVDHLQRKVIEWLKKQLYFNFDNQREEYVLNFVEKELENMKNQNALKEVPSKGPTREFPPKNVQTKGFQQQEQFMKETKSLPQHQKNFMEHAQNSQNFLKQANLQKPHSVQNQASSQMHSSMQPQISTKEQQYQTHLQSQQAQLSKHHPQYQQHQQHQQNQQHQQLSQHVSLSHNDHPQQNAYLQSKHPQYSQQQQSHMNIEHPQSHISSAKHISGQQLPHPSTQQQSNPVVQQQTQDQRYQPSNLTNQHQHQQHQQYLQLSSGSQQPHVSQYQPSQAPTQHQRQMHQQHIQSQHPSQNVNSYYSQQTASNQVPVQNMTQSHKSLSSNQRSSNTISSHQPPHSHSLASSAQAQSPLSQKSQPQVQPQPQAQHQPQSQHYSHTTPKNHLHASGTVQQIHPLSGSHQQGRMNFPTKPYQAQSHSQTQPQSHSQTPMQTHAQSQQHQIQSPSFQNLQPTQTPIQTPVQSQSHEIQPQSVQKSHASPKVAPTMKVEQKKIKFIEKEKFNNIGFEGILPLDGEKKLDEVYKKLKNPFGNYEIIDRFMKDLYAELAESEVEEKIEKKIKPNPTVERELNVLPVKTSNMSIEEPKTQSLPALSQSINVNPFEAEINEIKKDSRFKVEDKGNYSLPSFDLTIYKTNDGIISFHDKIVVKLEKDSLTKIKILEMANLQDFFIDYQDRLEDALARGKLKQILELWLEFIDKFLNKAKSKVNALDELFGWE